MLYYIWWAIFCQIQLSRCIFSAKGDNKGGRRGLQHQAHTLETATVLGAGGADVDTGGVDAAVAQQVRQLDDVPAGPPA